MVREDTISVRRIRANTVEFDVPCVFLYDEIEGELSVIKAVVFRESDIGKYFMPHQMEDAVPYDTIRFGYLTVTPYGANFPPANGMEVDPNLTKEEEITWPDIEVARQIRHYKHHTRAPLMADFAIKVAIGSDFMAWADNTFMLNATLTTTQYDWFASPATEELIIIPMPTTLSFTEYLEDIEFTMNLAYCMSDWSMRDCVYSNYQIIRGNEYGARRHIIF